MHPAAWERGARWRWSACEPYRGGAGRTTANVLALAGANDLMQSGFRLLAERTNRAIAEAELTVAPRKHNDACEETRTRRDKADRVIPLPRHAAQTSSVAESSGS